jgi:hypothetical protein
VRRLFTFISHRSAYPATIHSSPNAFPQFFQKTRRSAAIAIDTIFPSHDNPMKVWCLPDEFQPLHARAWAASGGDRYELSTRLHRPVYESSV